jgi:hypothetical protein
MKRGIYCAGYNRNVSKMDETERIAMFQSGQCGAGFMLKLCEALIEGGVPKRCLDWGEIRDMALTYSIQECKDADPTDQDIWDKVIDTIKKNM